jgi:FecR-like protein
VIRPLATLALLASSAALAGAGTVSELEGSATRTPKDAAAPVLLKEGDAVEVGDVLEVASGGNMAITLSDESVIALGEGSRLQLDEARFGEEGSTTFSARLLLGSIWAKVTKLAAGSDSRFEVVTERGVAGVRGTVFTVDLGEGRDSDFEVGVEEGEVEVAHAVSEEAPHAAVAMSAPRPPSMLDRTSGAGGKPPPRFPRVERIAAGNAVTFGPHALARHRFQLRRARMAAFVGKHRERWVRRALERERARERRLLKQEVRERREERRR